MKVAVTVELEKDGDEKGAPLEEVRDALRDSIEGLDFDVDTEDGYAHYQVTSVMLK